MRSACPATDGRTLDYVITYPKDSFSEFRSEWERLWRESNEATDSQMWDFISEYSHHIRQARPLVIAARDNTGTYVAAAAFSVCRDPVSLRRKLSFVGDKSVDYHVFLAR